MRNLSAAVSICMFSYRCNSVANNRKHLPRASSQTVCGNGNTFYVHPRPIADDRKQDARDRKFSIVTSCCRRVQCKSEETTIRKHNCKLFLIVCDQIIDDVFVHMIWFDELEASRSNENGVRVRLWQ